jgi:membrane protease YdiL (CAAX protease family)
MGQAVNGSQEKALLRREQLVQYWWRIGVSLLAEVIWMFTLIGGMAHGFHGRYDKLAMYIASGFFAGAFWGYVEWCFRICRRSR